MFLNRYQYLAGRTDNNHDTDYYVHLLCAEAGEVAALFQKIRHGKPLDETKLKLELGDCLWAVARLAHRFGISLKDVARANIEKLEARHPDKFSGDYAGDSDEVTP